MNDRCALVLAGVALAGAAWLAQDAFAGNYNAAVPNGAGIHYFSVELLPGQKLGFSGVSGAQQFLVDDVTYSIQYVPEPMTVASATPLWAPSGITVPLNTTYMTSYQFLPPPPLVGVVVNPLIANLTGTRALMVGFGAVITMDDDLFSDSRQAVIDATMTEFNGSTVVRNFDQCAVVFHASMFGRQTVMNQVNTGPMLLAASVGISEVLALTSDSRHYQTPHIVPVDHTIACISTTGALVTRVFVKGRVVVDAENVLVDVSGNATIE